MGKINKAQAADMRSKLRRDNPSRNDQGGPLEKAAQADDHKQKFEVFVMSDGVGGRTYIDPYKSGTERKWGAAEDDDPEFFQVDLWQFDKSRAALSSNDEHLDAILFERDCIKFCRLKSESNPNKSGEKMYKYWEAAGFEDTTAEEAFEGMKSKKKPKPTKDKDKDK